MDSIDLGRALKAPFQDKAWPSKTLLGFLWILLGVTSPAVYGAQLEYITRVANGNEELPEWSDFGNKWIRGLLVSIAACIYFLPVIVVGMITLLPAAAALAASGGDSGGGLLAGGTCMFALFAIVYGVGVSILFYAAVVHYAVKGNFGAFFEFSEILAHVRDGSGYFVAWLWSIVVAMIFGVAVSVVSSTGIGAILAPAATYLMTMMMGHLFGQWAARSYGYSGLAPAAVYPASGAGAPTGYAPPPPPPAYAPPAPPTPPAYTPPAPAAPPAYIPPAPAAPPAYEPPAPPAYAPPAPPAYEPPAAPVSPETPSSPPAPPAAPSEASPTPEADTGATPGP